MAEQNQAIDGPPGPGVRPSGRRFDRLHSRYRHSVAAFFSRRGFSPEECRDLTQETFLRVFQNIEDLRDEAAEKRWLFTVATNIYRNELRHRGAEKRSAPVVSLDAASERGLQLDAAAGNRNPGLPAPLGDALAAERRRMLRRALAALPARMRLCTLMRLGQGLKYREIAAVLQISTETVKVQLHQARKRLAERLGDHFTELDR